jgi:hypothetical protein
MKTEQSLRAALRDFVVTTNGKIALGDLRDDTPLLEERIISSLQLTELILFLESLRDAPVDLGQLKGTSFRDLNAVYDTFLREVSHA